MDILADTLLFDLDAIETELASGRESLVQFSHAPEAPAKLCRVGADGELLDGPEVDLDLWFARLNRLCATYGDRLEVRFYGFYGGVFDGALVDRIPEVRRLTVNCIHDGKNIQHIGTLPHLCRLGLGVYNLEDKGVLSTLPIGRLTELVLEETATKALDLAPLAGAVALRRLMLVGHRKNLDALGELGDLAELSFNPFRGVELDFLNRMTGLRALKLVLGGTESLASVAPPNLEVLALTMVKGVADLGDLSRFPKLRQMLLQDQQHIEALQFGRENRALRHVWLYNCRKLSALQGLAGLPALESLHAVRTALTLEALDPPPGLTHLSLFSGRRRDEPAERAAIEALGVNPEPLPAMPFFYK